MHFPLLANALKLFYYKPQERTVYHTHLHCHYMQVINIKKVISQDTWKCVATCLEKHATENLSINLFFFGMCCMCERAVLWFFCKSPV